VALLLPAGDALHHAAREQIHPGDTAKRVDEEHLGVRVREDDAHGRAHVGLGRAAAAVEEVGRLSE
jgi:hypothetical protein